MNITTDSQKPGENMDRLLRGKIAENIFLLDRSIIFLYKKVSENMNKVHDRRRWPRRSQKMKHTEVKSNNEIFLFRLYKKLYILNSY